MSEAKSWEGEGGGRKDLNVIVTDELLAAGLLHPKLRDGTVAYLGRRDPVGVLRRLAPSPPAEDQGRAPAADERARPSFLVSLAAPLKATSGIEAEWARYTTEVPEDTSPRAFWAARVRSYPVLAPLGLELATTPASTTSVERAFSSMGYYLNDRRNRMSTRVLAAMVVLRDWETPVTLVPAKEVRDGGEAAAASGPVTSASGSVTSAATAAGSGAPSGDDPGK
jgi:hypothetical protein